MGKDTDTAAVHRWPGDAGSLSPAGPLSPSPQRSTDGGKTFASCDVSPKADLNAVAVVPGSTTTAWAVGAAVSSKTVSCWCGMTQRGGPARCKFPAARSTPQATASSVLLPGAVGAQDHRRRCHLDTANSHQLAALPDLDESHFHAGCECVLRGWQLWHVSALGMCVAGRVLRSWTQAGCSRANGTATPQPNVVIRQQVALCTGQLCCHPSPCPRSIWRTTNGGATWEDVSFTRTSLSFISVLVWGTAASHSVLVGTNQGRMMLRWVAKGAAAHPGSRSQCDAAGPGRSTAACVHACVWGRSFANRCHPRLWCLPRRLLLTPAGQQSPTPSAMPRPDGAHWASGRQVVQHACVFHSCRSPQPAAAPIQARRTGRPPQARCHQPQNPLLDFRHAAALPCSRAPEPTHASLQQRRGQALARPLHCARAAFTCPDHHTSRLVCCLLPALAPQLLPGPPQTILAWSQSSSGTKGAVQQSTVRGAGREGRRLTGGYTRNFPHATLSRAVPGQTSAAAAPTAPLAGRRRDVAEQHKSIRLGRLLLEHGARDHPRPTRVGAGGCWTSDVAERLGTAADHLHVAPRQMPTCI